MSILNGFVYETMLLAEGSAIFERSRTHLRSVYTFTAFWVW